MKKYLIVFAAMAVAVSSCTEKMSSGDNVPDGGDKVPEKVKLVKRITHKSWKPDDMTNLDTSTYDFSYDADNRIIQIITNRSNRWSDELRTTTELRVYSGNTATYTCVGTDGRICSRQTLLFDGGKVTEVNVVYDNSSYSSCFLYNNNSEKATAVTMDGELVYEFVWDKLGNMVRLVGQDPEEEYILPVSYTSTVNKCNIAIEHLAFGFVPVSSFIERNVFGSLCSNCLVEKIDGGTYSTYLFSYKFDEDGYPIEVYIPGKIFENEGGHWFDNQKYELEYY